MGRRRDNRGDSLGECSAAVSRFVRDAETDDDQRSDHRETQGLRDRKTLRVNYPLANKKLPAGETNAATQQIDFYIRSPQQNPKNRPNRQVFVHFVGMEIAWK